MTEGVTAAVRDAGTAPIELPPPHPTIVPATDLGGVGVLKHGNLYLLSDAFGDIHPDSRGLGFYDLDTRVLSCAVLRVNGIRPTLLRGQTAANHISSIQLTNPELRRDPTAKQPDELALARRALAIFRRRWIAGGLAERIEVTNYSAHDQEVTLDLDVDVDDADIFEVRGYPRTGRGTFGAVEATDRSLLFSYRGRDKLLRRTWLEFTPGLVGPGQNEGSVQIRWALQIPSGGRGEVSWEARTDLRSLPDQGVHREETPTRLAEALSDLQMSQSASAEGADGKPSGKASGNGHARASDRVTRADRGDGTSGKDLLRTIAVRQPAEADAEYGAWNDGCARIGSDGELLDLAVKRSIADLRLLQNDGPRPGEHYIAAGIPWFTTLFGRDSIITALQVAPFMPSVARQTLQVLADWQATEEDPSRDMEPGKILHELRTGEMARTGELPFRPYYGSVDATPLWLVLLEETYRWTGDLGLVRSLWDHALAALEWIDRWGDRDRDGFVEYDRQSPTGLANQGWKDSGDSVRHRDGSLARGAIALVEVQGYVYDAKLRMSHLARRLGDVALAERLAAEAAGLRSHFDAAFWMEDRGFYAMALDGEKRQVGSITSNPGHCLWSGIVPAERVDRVVATLLDPAMDSGWGIRTYASGQPGFNPVGYHTGSVWPHDNSIIAAGMKRAGRHDAADRVASRMFEASQHAPDFRLPELYCGFDRGAADIPVPYPVACSPQAWAAATPLFLLQTMLGMRANAADRILELDRPHLPSWLGKVTVHDLQVGGESVDLLFHRWRGNTTSAEVLRRSGSLELVIRV